MARPRNFDETEVVSRAGELFACVGYNAASIDDLLRTTGLQRGSLYKAFGSKRNLFEKVLRGALAPGWVERGESLDLLIIALKELAATDPGIAELCREAVEGTTNSIARVLGERLLLHLNPKC